MLPTREEDSVLDRTVECFEILFCVGFVVDKLAWTQDFLPVFRLALCQYHSTDAQYPFTHLSPTLYNRGGQNAQVACNKSYSGSLNAEEADRERRLKTSSKGRRLTTNRNET